MRYKIIELVVAQPAMTDKLDIYTTERTCKVKTLEVREAAAKCLDVTIDHIRHISNGNAFVFEDIAVIPPSNGDNTVTLIVDECKYHSIIKDHRTLTDQQKAFVVYVIRTAFAADSKRLEF